MKKIIKILSWIVGGIIVLIIIAAVALHLFFPLEKVKVMALEKGSALLGREVKISDVNISYWGGVGVKLQNVSIGNPSAITGDDFLDADNIDLKLRLFPLLTGKIKIDRLIINHPRITLIKQNNEINNYTFKRAEKETIPPMAKKVSSEAKIAFAAVTFDNLQINHAHIKYIDKSTQKRIVLKDFNLSTSLTNPDLGLYKSSGNMAVESLLTSANIPLPPLSVMMKYDAVYNLSNQSISINQATVNINNIELQFKGNLSQLTSDVKGKGNIKLEQASLTKLLALAPKKYLKKLNDIKTDGNISFNMDFDYDAAHKNPLTYFGTAMVSSLRLTYGQIPGTLRINEALLDFKNDNLRFNIRKGQFDDKP
ncbi:MAG: AsmA family protein, partial [FCB group bacterium]|nr:AsmA family protein [FCB group bacterium]